MADAARRTFGPVVLLGVASAGAAALAGNRPWSTFDMSTDPVVGTGAYDSAIAVSLSRLPEAPLVAALAYVVLASWGVLLVTRGRFRRGVAVLALLVSVGMLVAAVVAFVTTPGDLRDDFAALGDAVTRADPSGRTWAWWRRSSRSSPPPRRSGSSLAGRRWAAGTTPPVRRPHARRGDRPRPVAGPGPRT